MKSLIIAATLLFVPAHSLSAQQQRTTQTETIETLLARIERLERRVAELEGSKVQAQPATQRTEQTQVPAEALHPEVAQSVSEGPSLKIAGFSDFNFSGSDQKGTKSGFTEGQFVLNFNYNFGVGNGRGSVISRGGDAGDINNSRAWLVNMFIKPDKLYGLQVGGSAYRDKISTGGRDFGEWISSAHVVWNRETPEVIAEFANVRHENLTTASPVSNSQAYYVQTGYRLPVFDKRFKPYYRFEYIHIPRSDFLFQSPVVPNLAGSVAGLRYDLTSFAALKFEYRNQRRDPGQPRINSGFVQTSFTF